MDQFDDYFPPERKVARLAAIPIALAAVAALVVTFLIVSQYMRP